MIIASSPWFHVARFAAFLLLAFAALPALVVVPVSFTDTAWLSFPKHSLSLDHWRTLFFTPQWRDSLIQSAIVTVISTALSVLMGTLAAIGLRNLTHNSASVFRLILIAPMIVPGVIAGLAWYRVFIPLKLLDTFFGVVLAYTVTSIPLVFVAVTSSLSGFDSRLEQAARSMGARTGTVLWRVVIPSIRPGILSGAIFAFIASWDEVVILLFITSRKIYLLPRAVWDGINENLDPAIAAASTLMIIVTTTALLFSQVAARTRPNQADLHAK